MLGTNPPAELRAELCIIVLLLQVTLGLQQLELGHIRTLQLEFGGKKMTRMGAWWLMLSTDMNVIYH